MSVVRTLRKWLLVMWEPQAPLVSPGLLGAAVVIALVLVLLSVAGVSLLAQAIAAVPAVIAFFNLERIQAEMRPDRARPRWWDLDWRARALASAWGLVIFPLILAPAALLRFAGGLGFWLFAVVAISSDAVLWITAGRE